MRRLTISLSDSLAQTVRRRAAAQGMRVSALLETLILAGLRAQDGGQSVPPFRLVTFGGGGPRHGVDLESGARLTEQGDAGPLVKAGR